MDDGDIFSSVCVPHNVRPTYNAGGKKVCLQLIAFGARVRSQHGNGNWWQ